MNKISSQALPDLEIPGRVTFQDGQGELPTIEIRSTSSEAEVYLHGAHVTHFQKRAEPPLLFMSKVSCFKEGTPIRGGVPVIFPWFGLPEGRKERHGYARIKPWQLREITLSADGSTRLHFRLPDCAEAAEFPACLVDYFVTVSEKLVLELRVENTGKDRPLVFENCLHTYFTVGDVGAVEIRGLKGVSYLDSVDGMAKKTETADSIRIAGEVDRVYLDSPETVEIADAKLARVIRIQKEGSNSTVVWNPWIAKSQAMPDFGNEEYLQMVCVESGNVGQNRITLAPGQASTLQVTLSSAPL